MRKHLLALLLILIAVVYLNSCKKDPITEVVSGNYRVAGWMTQAGDSINPRDSTYIAESQVEISKVDDNHIGATFHLPVTVSLTMEQRTDVNEVYYFEGVYGNFPGRVFFYKTDVDSIFVDYNYQIDDSTVVNYNLIGRKI